MFNKYISEIKDLIISVLCAAEAEKQDPQNVKYKNSTIPWTAAPSSGQIYYCNPPGSRIYKVSIYLSICHIYTQYILFIAHKASHTF